MLFRDKKRGEPLTEASDSPQRGLLGGLLVVTGDQRETQISPPARRSGAVVAGPQPDDLLLVSKPLRFRADLALDDSCGRREAQKSLLVLLQVLDELQVPFETGKLDHLDLLLGRMEHVSVEGFLQRSLALGHGELRALWGRGHGVLSGCRVMLDSPRKQREMFSVATEPASTGLTSGLHVGGLDPALVERHAGLLAALLESESVDGQDVLGSLALGHDEALDVEHDIGGLLAHGLCGLRLRETVDGTGREVSQNRDELRRQGLQVNSGHTPSLGVVSGTRNNFSSSRQKTTHPR